MDFLQARWEDLILANYAIDPAVLGPYVPAGTELDFHDGICYVSLVAFMFRKTRVVGVPVPFHQNFEEVNLRFYIRPTRQPALRSVAFIREIVPHAAIPLISNTLFKEHYRATRMGHRIEYPEISYRWGKNQEHAFSARLPGETYIPAAGSVEEFITEHYHGFSAHPRGTLHYRVFHPQWQISSLEDYAIEVDFGANYGGDFAFLNDATPVNVCYALGSEVSVSFPSRMDRESDLS
jgi:uncharacterized protein YqjF (DUF2071 family)